MSRQFRLDPRLEADSVFVAALDLCDVRLMNDAAYPWLILVPRLADVIEILDLDNATRHRLIDEIARASEALRATVGAEKLNIAALGNQVPQLHVHVIARFRTDPAWPGPVWGAAPRRAYGADERGELIERLADRLT